MVYASSYDISIRVQQFASHADAWRQGSDARGVERNGVGAK